MPHDKNTALSFPAKIREIFKNRIFWWKTDFFQNFWKNLQNWNWATETSSCRKKTCDTALEPPGHLFLSYKHNQVYAHIRHILGTHQAHRAHIHNLENLENFLGSPVLLVPGVCLVCAWCVHIIMVFITQKYGPRRFQRRVTCYYTTKTRFCDSIWFFIIFVKKLSFVPTAQHLSPREKKNLKNAFSNISP